MERGGGALYDMLPANSLPDSCVRITRDGLPHIHPVLLHLACGEKPPCSKKSSQTKGSVSSILEALAVPIPHGSVANIGDEHRCVLLIRLRKYVGCDPAFVREGPSPS